MQCRKNSWKALSELKEQGKIRDLGVSNFQIEALFEVDSSTRIAAKDHIKELQSLNLAPVAVHQPLDAFRSSRPRLRLQYHPWLPDWQQKVVEPLGVVRNAFRNAVRHAFRDVFSCFSLSFLASLIFDLFLFVFLLGTATRTRSPSQPTIRWAAS